MFKAKLIEKLSNGIPPKTACALLRIEFSEYLKEYASNLEFRLDVEKAQAEALEQVVACLYYEARADSKAAITYLKNRDEQNWADTQKTEIIEKIYLNDLLETLSRTLKPETYAEVLEALEQAALTNN